MNIGLIVAEELTQEILRVNKIAREIIENYEKQTTILFKTYQEKCQILIEKKVFLLKKIDENYNPDDIYAVVEHKRLNEKFGKIEQELSQLQIWEREQETLLAQEKKRKEEEIAKIYLKNYVQKELVFFPWGEKEGEMGLSEEEILVQGREPCNLQIWGNRYNSG